MSALASGGCTSRTAADRFCGAEIPSGAPVTLCGPHLIQAYQFCVDSLEIAGKSATPAPADLARPAESRVSFDVVYYVERGNLIKIGTTSNLVRRMLELQPDRILAVEPGGLHLERQRHRQFQDAAVLVQRGREHFHRTEPLLEHIGVVVTKHGRPAVTLEHEHHRWHRYALEVLAQPAST